jgi:hypothetical protein
LALGASRGQLRTQLLTESCVLAAAGGALGLVLAMWTLRTLQAVIPPDGMAFVATTLNGRLLLFCVGLSVASGLVFGLYPAVRFSRPDLAGQLRKSLVTMQTAVAVLLLVVAGLFGRTLVNLTRVDLGMQTGQLVTLSVMP